MFRLSNYLNLSQTMLYIMLFFMGIFQLRNQVKAEIFQPNQFIIIVYGYPSRDHNIKKGMKTAQLYLETQDGKSIKFCPEGNGRYISKCPNTAGEGEFDLEKEQSFTITISHENYSKREINFLRYPFEKKGSTFTFYLFKRENYQIDSSYNQQGTSLFCYRTNCNSIIDKAVSYYELAENSLDRIPDLETKKNIIYNLARSKFDAWKVLDYDTCNQAYDYFSQVNSLLGNTNTNNEIHRELVSIGYIMKDQNGQETIKKKEDFCKKGF